MRSVRTVLVAAAAAVLAGCATVEPAPEFASCADARAAVAATGRLGLPIGPIRVHDDPMCYIHVVSSSIPQYRTFDGERCLIGYFCTERTGIGTTG